MWFSGVVDVREALASLCPSTSLWTVAAFLPRSSPTTLLPAKAPGTRTGMGTVRDSSEVLAEVPGAGGAGVEPPVGEAGAGHALLRAFAGVTNAAFVSGEPFVEVAGMVCTPSGSFVKVMACRVADEMGVSVAVVFTFREGLVADRRNRSAPPPGSITLSWCVFPGCWCESVDCSPEESAGEGSRSSPRFGASDGLGGEALGAALSELAIQEWAVQERTSQERTFQERGCRGQTVQEQALQKPELQVRMVFS